MKALKITIKITFLIHLLLSPDFVLQVWNSFCQFLHERSISFYILFIISLFAFLKFLIIHVTAVVVIVSATTLVNVAIFVWQKNW